MTDAGQAGNASTPREIGVTEIFRCARVLFVENWRRSLIVWVMLGIVEALDAYLNVVIAGHLFELMAYTAGYLAVVIFLSGMAIRALIGSLETVWILDRAFWEYAKACAILALPFFLANILLLAFVRLASYASTNVFLATDVIWVLGYAALFILVGLRGMLWPIGQLLGDAESTFGQSALRMQGILASTFWAIIVAGIAIGGPEFAINAVMGRFLAGSSVQDLLQTISSCAFGLARDIIGTLINASVFIIVSLRDRGEPA